MAEKLTREQKRELEEIKSAFKFFDPTSRGFISVPELTHTLQTVGEKLSNAEIEEMLKEANANAKGQIRYEEFLIYLMTKYN